MYAPAPPRMTWVTSPSERTAPVIAPASATAETPM